jgi:Arc/MetJ-type ribon-helix-helix transcriptional regulator
MNEDIPDFSRSESSSNLEHVTFRADEDLLEEIDELVETGEYKNRSRAIRDLLDDAL